jgi:hypothetical protein
MNLQNRWSVAYLLATLHRAVAADVENSDPVLSGGGITALVLLVVFSAILLGSCIYQSRKKSDEDLPEFRILRCAGCRRSFRVPSVVDGAEFMCSRCVTEGRRRMSLVLEEERMARFARMREAANQSVKLERVTSTFFRVSNRSKSTLGRSKTNTDLREETTKDLEAASSTECKICFDDESCIVLVPCGHSGLCEGCAKDLVTLTKECYICRSEIELIAKIKSKISTQKSYDENATPCGSSTLFDAHLSAFYVAPDTLHHQASRRNTAEEGGLLGLPPPTMEMSRSRRSTINNLDNSLLHRPDTIAEETPRATSVEQQPSSEAAGPVL